MKNKKVIVTGGLGFIGSNLVEKLIEDNTVTIIDDQSTGKLSNIIHLAKDNLTLIKGSICDLNLTEIFKGHDYLFHLAAQTSVPLSIEKPDVSNKINITGTVNVLLAARNSGVKKVVFASSAAVYGDLPELPKSEDMPVRPLSPYAVEKLTGEFYCQVFKELYGLETISLRYFNVFGPRQDPDSQYASVIPRFIDAISNNVPPVIFGDGEQTRDFISVDHVVNANILACESDASGVFNIASGRRTTINNLVDIINEITGKTVRPVYEDPRAGDIIHSVADISKALQFGYRPKIDFKYELKETVRWFSDGEAEL